MRLEFDARLYTLKAVEEAARTYADWGPFRVKRSGKFIRVEAKGKNNRFDATFGDEFANYVLGATRP